MQYYKHSLKAPLQPRHKPFGIYGECVGGVNVLL